MSDISAVNSVSATVKDGKVTNANSKNVSAEIKDGKVENANNDKKDKTAPSGYDKDSFLKILVAQMKYQDPMEPTSNTEYISQYATFSQVEQMNNMANAMNLSRASDMVGKTVKVQQVNSETGKTTEAEGVVDFVTYSGNKAYLSINGSNYDVDDVIEVLSDNYANTKEIVDDFKKNMDKLPNTLELVSLGEIEGTVKNLKEYYDSLDDETKNLIGKDYETALKQYANRVTELREAFEGFLNDIDNLPPIENTTLGQHADRIDTLYDKYMNYDWSTKQLVDDERKNSLLAHVNKIDELRGDDPRTLSGK